jgi:hypothetical protein
MTGEMFLMGYSEGGYATLATQKEIESNYSDEFDLTGVAPCAGPYDLYGMLMRIFQDGSYSTPAYVAYIITAYNDIYGWDRLDHFFNEPYASQMLDLFDGSKTWIEVIAQLPGTLAELLNPAFVTDVLDGKEAEFVAAYQENTLLDWMPIAPVHFFHGDADQSVFYENALTAIDNLSSFGGTDLQLTTIPGGTHSSASSPSIIGAIEWFEELRNATLALTR